MSRDLERAREILRTESIALNHAAELLDEKFLEVVDAMDKTAGKIVLTGVGKSGIVAMKIAATLSSTGTPALFLHAVEAVMGDLGILAPSDLLIAISNSGETNEVVNVVLAAAEIGTPAVAVTNNPESTLAQECRYLLPLHFEREAGKLGLAPTTSTTLTMGLGDALALVLKERREFTPEQFARYHPGGALGRRLALRVRDIMRTGDQLPILNMQSPLSEALEMMSRKLHAEGSRFDAREPGVVLAVNDTGQLTGILTDGDLRRVFRQSFSSGSASTLPSEPLARHMTPQPLTVEGDVQASEALRIMEVREITVLPIVDGAGQPIGHIHLHDILGRGKFIL